MSYQIQVVKKEEMKTAKWSGGTTTQLAIFPDNASYTQRDFLWRLSSATVETESSEFTLLPGIKRIIMIIKGNLTLIHEGQYEKYLQPYDQDHFNGDWCTKSIGKVVDFNLMMASCCTGNLRAIHIDTDDAFSITIAANASTNLLLFTGLYITGGQVEISVTESQMYILNEGDLLITSMQNLNDDVVLEVRNRAMTPVNIVKIQIEVSN